MKALEVELPTEFPDPRKPKASHLDWLQRSLTCRFGNETKARIKGRGGNFTRMYDVIEGTGRKQRCEAEDDCRITGRNEVDIRKRRRTGQ